MPLNISWSPDGTVLAAGYTTEQAAEATTTLQFWETQHGKARFSYQAPGFPHQLLWSPDSHSLATFTSQPTPLHFCAMGCHGFSFHKFLRVFEIG
ncbi:hypothetical protein [Ktedonobacter sp. SOSP1-52]|uniref:hypothetical protein n=1 Tax=Ktedonobacter sp. SOSP1-52 TaxID=2778366 RepID=UPI001F1ABE5B|nr:hypothetical protein [Ktedonobacter sp. SOSP1-52]